MGGVQLYIKWFYTLPTMFIKHNKKLNNTIIETDINILFKVVSYLLKSMVIVLWNTSKNVFWVGIPPDVIVKN